jgi:hypothetical protein
MNVQIPLTELMKCPSLSSFNETKTDEQNQYEQLIMIEKIAYLEAKCEEQQKINMIQTHDLIKLEKKVEGIHNVLFHLIPSLFNHKTQKHMFEMNMNELLGRNHIQESYYNSLPNSGGNYATTRQGDQNTARIEELEKMVEQLLARNAEEEKEEVMSKTSVDSCSSEERIKTSYSLCGNE